MESSNNFFLNTNQNAQLNQLPLQPFAPTPNPRSRFPQHQIPQTGGAPGLTVPKSESFYITVSPPADQSLVPPFTNTLGAENPFLLSKGQALSSRPSSTNSLSGSMNSQATPTHQDLQSTLSPGRFTSPTMEQKGLYRKKGYSVGNQSQPNNNDSFDQDRKFSYEKNNPDYYSDSKTTLTVPGRRSFGAPPNEKGPASTQGPNSMELLQIPGNSWKSLSSMSDDKDSVEDVMIMIEEHQINTVSMLNEVSSKIKKRIEYSMNETPHGKNRVFECVCLMEKAKIGTGKGNSKQAAKTEAAKTAISTLISKSIYANEGQAVLVSIKKAAGQPGSHSPSISGKTNSNLNKSSEQIISDRDDSAGNSFDMDNTMSSNNLPFTGSGNAHMNDSPLYELNVIAKECFIEPKWTLSPQPNEETGEFEVELRFDKLVACGKGKKKQDAKRDAAIKIIKQIRSSNELTERFNPKSKKLSKASSFMTEPSMNDKDKRFFDEALNYSFFEDIHRKNYSLKDAVKKTNQDLEALLISLGEKQKFDTSATDTFRDLFKKIQDYTSMITSATKQIMIDASKHVADFIGNCYLIPIGSFALGCLRKDKPVADCIMMFHEVQEIEDSNFLELYKQALEECQSLDDRNSGYHPFKNRCKFVVKSNCSQHYLEVTTSTENEHFKINIHIFNLTQQLKLSKEKLATQRYENWIIHVKRIYDSLEHIVDELPNFRTLLIALRAWREKNCLISLPTQILDIVLLSEFLNNNPINIASIITNCLTIMSSEDSLQNTLSRFGEFYKGLYEELPQESKVKVHEASSQSLSSIFIGELSSAKFF